MATALVTSLAQAITQQENIPASLNNPGALMNVGQAGVVGTASNGLAIFDTPQDGLNALYSQIQANINRGLTLNQFFAGAPGVYAGYAPAAAGNDPVTYAANVSAWTGIDPNVPLNQISSAGTSSPMSTASTAVSSDGTTQPLIDLTGDASTQPTSDILASLESSVGLDPTSPVSDVVLVAAAAGVAALLLFNR